MDMRDQETCTISNDYVALDSMYLDGWWTLLKNKRIPAYCGLETICFLSSGLIRSGIEIVYRIFKEALTDNWDIVQQANCIPYDIQDSAIRREAQYWFKTKLLADIRGRAWDEEPLANVASQLISNLLRRFSYMFLSAPNEVALNCFSLRELKDKDADGIKALKEGVASGIFTQLDETSISPKDIEAYAVHRIFSVRNNLPPILTGCLRLPWDKFEEYCRRPRGAVGKQKGDNVTYFFGIGFREIWENRVRTMLQGKSPPGYTYSDGAGAHDGSILVVGTVKNRIQAARLCVFDVTTQNENVLFEYGLAVAKRKPIRHLLNRLKAKVTDTKKLIPLLRGINFEMYSLSNNASEDELTSLKKAIENAIDWYERYRKRRGHAGHTCSLDDKCRFNPAALNNQIYIAAPQGSMVQRCLSDICTMIREELKLQVYPNITSVDRHYICNFCQGTGRSKYCIVDTTGCDPTYCGVLGLAFGYGRRVLNIYERNRSGLITNYAGQGPKEYVDKEQILHEIRTFVQMAEVNEDGKS